MTGKSTQDYRGLYEEHPSKRVAATHSIRNAVDVQHHESGGFTDYHRMEHRLSRRKSCDLSATIRYRDIELPFCSIRNSSRDGLAIDTELIWLPHGIVVEIVVNCPEQPSGTKLLALVVYSEPGFAGLWVGDDVTQQETLQMLVGQNQNLMRATA